MNELEQVRQAVSRFCEGTPVLSRDGRHKGKTTGAKFHCRLHGCTGMRITVRWSDGKITHPCSKGLVWNKRRSAYQIA